MSLKILATADIHIGRRPSKLSDSESATDFSCARMWGAIVGRAIDEKVDLVALVGDIVDHDNRFFEATGPFELGLHRLGEQGIHTYAVAGNHDYDVLPRIAEVIDAEHFRVLGLGGHWEEEIWTDSDGRDLRIRGWSFPERHVATSPLASYSLSPGGEIPTLGLMHADLDVAHSQYGPVARRELLAHDMTIWVLGHVHRPQYEAAEVAPLLYPGSPQPMDPSETGAHGPWLIEIHGPRHATATQLPMATVRYDQFKLDLTRIETEADFQHQASKCVSDHLTEAVGDSESLREYWLRLELVGQTGLCRWLERDGARRLEEQLERHVGEAFARIEKTINSTMPVVDLGELAQKQDPPGVLARMLLQLQSGKVDDQLNELLENTRQSMMEVHESRPYAGVDSDLQPEREAARQCLVRQGMLLLETLRSQERSS